MIIFGTRGVKSTKEKGQFHCPQCDRQTGYRHRKVTKFFTLYFIPLIPLGSAGEYVECDNCRCTFIPRVLDNTPSNDKDAFMAIYQKAIRHSMVLIMLADGVIEDAEKKQVLKVINQFGHDDISMSELDEFVAQVKNSIVKVNTYLAEVGPMLNEHGKESILKAAISVAASDGHIDGREIDEIHEMAKAMEMSQAHVDGIMAAINTPASLN